MHSLIDAEPSTDELDRARNYVIGGHEISMQRADSQTMTMALMELYGFGYDDFLTYPERVAAVTTSDISRIASRLFRKDAAVEVMVGDI